jgi:hypothetical protein
LKVFFIKSTYLNTFKDIMKKLIYLLVVALVCNTFSITAQNIKMELLVPQPFLQGSDTGDMEFADLDGDGNMDLISTGSGNMSDGTAHGALTTLYFNDGAGNFTAVSNHGLENIRVSKIALADIDADDDLDLMISGATQGATPLTKLYTNDGTGTFTEVVSTLFDTLENGYFNFGDIDGDTDQDIIYSGSDNIFDVVAFINDGSGNFSLSSDIGVTNISGVLELFDADGDNDLDILIMGVDQDEEVVTNLYKNNGAGSYTIFNNAGFNPLNFGDIAIGDTDGDGDKDVLIAGMLDFDVESEFYTNNGDGTFTLAEDVPFMDLGFDGETSFNDFDNDGDLDVFIIGSADGGLPNIFSHIYENLGSNNFILSDEFTGAYLSTHAVADIDGDSLLDVVIGGTTTGNPVRGSFMYKNASLLNTNDETIRTNISIYPNPSNDFINICSDKDQLQKIELYSMTGRLIFKTDLNTNTYALNISNYPIGTYLLWIVNQNNESIHTKIMKK